MWPVRGEVRDQRAGTRTCAPPPRGTAEERQAAGGRLDARQAGLRCDPRGHPRRRSRHRRPQARRQLRRAHARSRLDDAREHRDRHADRRARRRAEARSRAARRPRRTRRPRSSRRRSRPRPRPPARPSSRPSRRRAATSPSSSTAPRHRRPSRRSSTWPRPATGPRARATASPREGIYVLQCGDPTGTGQGGPGYTFGIENAPKDGKYPTGVLAMARTQDPNSNGGQFFITYKETQLPTDGGGYTIFGKVTKGLDIVEQDCRQQACHPARRTAPVSPDQHPQRCVTEKKA